MMSPVDDAWKARGRVSGCCHHHCPIGPDRISSLRIASLIFPLIYLSPKARRSPRFRDLIGKSLIAIDIEGSIDSTLSRKVRAKN